ncbi:MAG: LLM class flavin-dependent oxidoreductase [Pseudomonadales bacterium]|nr:LLM class flavin-dependent oxidoreductase [Pseudomonadales bacterium]
MLIGTLASPEILSAPHRVRREHVARILDAGIDHVFVADHVSFHVGAGMDGLINAATLTALDARLKVCVGVYLLALRHPVTVARQLATLAETAPGQVLLGIGVGGEDRNEFAMCGIDPRTRGARTDEALGIVQRLLTGEPLDHQGRFYQFERGWIRPKPSQPIPMLIGGRTDKALARAARFGDGWLAVWCSPQRFAAATAEVDAAAQAAGRAAPRLHGLQVWVGIDNDRDKARARLARGMESFYRIPFAKFEKYSPWGSAAEIADFLAAYRDAGCELFNIMPLAETEAAGIDAVAEIRQRLQ